MLGIRDFSDVHKAAQQAINESDKATKTAQVATVRAQEADDRAIQASKAIVEASTKTRHEIEIATQLTANLSGLDEKTTHQIADANKHIETRVTELDKRLEIANKTIAEQQVKLTSTNELVTAMFSKGQVEYFQTAQDNTSTFVSIALPAPPGVAQRGAFVFMLLKSAPIYQTVQINFRIFVQPKNSYSVKGNVLMFFWGDPADNLKQNPLEVSYIPDPTYKGVVFSKLSVKDGHVFADAEQLR